MSRSTSEIIQLLSDFVPSIDDEYENIDFLEELTSELLNNDDRLTAIEPLFKFLERHSETYFGSPGPIVHFIEKHIGEYEVPLFESLDRRPTSTSIWMLNRIINSKADPTEKENLINKMRKAANQNLKDESVLSKIEGFRNAYLEEIPKEIVELLKILDSTKEEDCIEHTNSKSLLGK